VDEAPDFGETMVERIRPHLGFANVVSALALFIALGGSAYAVTLGKNDVKSRNIAPRAVKKSDLHKNAVTRKKVANNAVSSPEVLGDSLTGGDINEATFDASIQRAIQNLCTAGEAIQSIAPQGQVSCATIPGSVSLDALQAQVDALAAQLAGLQGQVDTLTNILNGTDNILGNGDDLSAQVGALCGSIHTAIESNFDALDAANLPLIGPIGSVTLPNLPNSLPTCP
jgi:hypothetical protein